MLPSRSNFGVKDFPVVGISRDGTTPKIAFSTKDGVDDQERDGPAAPGGDAAGAGLAGAGRHHQHGLQLGGEGAARGGVGECLFEGDISNFGNDGFVDDDDDCIDAAAYDDDDGVSAAAGRQGSLESIERGGFCPV